MPKALRIFLVFLLGVVLGLVVFASRAKASSGECETEADDCYAVIYTPGFCEMVPKYGWWWYFAYCDQREGGRLMASDTITYTPLPDGSFVVELFCVEGDHRVYMIRTMPKRGAR